MAHRFGYVALIGKPNVGKSTLLNHIVGQKVSIVSNKPQTTRKRVIGIATTDEYQIAFIDTPGIHEPHTKLGRSMVEQARKSLHDVDVIVYVADSSSHPNDGDKEIAKLLTGIEVHDLHQPEKHVPIPVILCLNKMDLLKAESVQRNVDAFTGLFKTEEYMLTTALRGNNVDKLVEMIVAKLPEGEPQFDPDSFTDQTSRFIAAEFVREKILIATKQEVPHAVAVLVEDWEEEAETGLVRITASIFVEKTSQRAILIGKQGQFIKKIGT
ncbi:MAG: GTPase Era, partial [Chlorobia bacterium]|nr:GTPase Era [Fimbriimonadaceae bacterium]